MLRRSWIGIGVFAVAVGMASGFAASVSQSREPLINGQNEAPVATAKTTPTEWITLKGHTRSAALVYFAPDGKTLASADRDGTILFWDLTKDRPIEIAPIRTADHYGTALLAYSPDSKRLVSVGVLQRQARLWEVAGAQPKLVPSSIQHRAHVYDAAFSPDGRTLATAGREGTVRLWDVSVVPPRAKAVLSGFGDSVSLVAFSPDGRTLAARGGDDIVLWDLGQTKPKRRRAVLTSDLGLDVIAFAPDGKTLVQGAPTLAEGQDLPACDVTVLVWDVAGARLLNRVVLKGKDYRVNRIAFSPDVRTLIAVDDNRRVIWWDISSGKKLREWAMPSIAYSVAFSPNGRHVATAHKDGTVRIIQLVPSP